MEDWERVVWSDKTKINRLGLDGQQLVWKKVGEGLIKREIQEIVKFSGRNIMVWGCMSWDSVGQLAEVEGRMNGDQYMDILENHLLPIMQEYEIPTEDLIF